MNWIGTTSYDIERPTGRCAMTGRTLEPGEPYIAALVEVDSQPDTNADNPGPQAARRKKTKEPLKQASGYGGLSRADVSLDAWEQNHRPDRLFSYWRSTVPYPHEKKKMFVDDEVLMDLMFRLGDDDRPQRAAFRFVLVLILMRKRLLRYDGSEKRTGVTGETQAWWRVTPKGHDKAIEVFNPQINDEQIQQVTEQLGQILEGEL